MNETIVTLEQWLAKRDNWQLAAEELIQLWFVHKLGTQVELAKHLGYSSRTIKRYVSKLREQGRIPELAKGDKRKRDKVSHSVETEQLRQEIITNGRIAMSQIGEGIHLLLMQHNMTVDEICEMFQDAYPPDVVRAGISSILSGGNFATEELIEYLHSQY